MTLCPLAVFSIRKGHQGFLFCKTTFEKGDFSKANAVAFGLVKIHLPFLASPSMGGRQASHPETNSG